METELQDAHIAEIEEMQAHIDELEGTMGAMEDQIEDLREENKILRRELALSSPKNVNTLMDTLVDYLDWSDAPNATMSGNVVEMVHTQLRSALDDAIRELR